MKLTVRLCSAVGFGILGLACYRTDAPGSALCRIKLSLCLLGKLLIRYEFLHGVSFQKTDSIILSGFHLLLINYTITATEQQFIVVLPWTSVSGRLLHEPKSHK